MKYFIIKQVKLLTSLFLLTNLLGSTTQAPQEAKDLEIAKLERERSELYKRISDALEASAKNLLQTNESNAKEGIALVTGLKKQLEIFNNTEDLNLNLSSLKSRRKLEVVDLASDEFFGDGGKKSESNSDNEDKKIINAVIAGGQTSKSSSKESDEARKNKKEEQNKVRKSIAKKNTVKPFMDKLYNKRYRSNKTWEKYLNRLQMKQRVEEWLIKKAAEKAAIKKYREQLTNGTVMGWGKERCPRFGIRQQSKKGGKKKKKFRGYYPCCRKCCKLSYLGCL